MKALVTGGAGFIGSHVAQHLLTDGMDVVVLDDLSGGFKGNIPNGAFFQQGSVNDPLLLGELFNSHQFDYVFHLAAYAAEGLSPFIRKFNYENNLIGSVNLINLSVKHQVKGFVFTSSIAVYGSLEPPMTEAMTPHPKDPYGIAKYAVEMDLRAAYEEFGLPYIIFRPHNVYGERQNMGDRYRNVIGIFMNQILRGEPLTIFGDGLQTRAFSYIDDVAPVIARSVQVPEAYGEVFNIGGEVPTSLNDLAQTVMVVMNADVPIRHLRDRNEVKHAIASHEKQKRVFGDQACTSLHEGLGKMADWARELGPQQEKHFGALEISTGLPEGW